MSDRARKTTIRFLVFTQINLFVVSATTMLKAAKVGLRFEAAGLSNSILDDVKDEPGAMP